MANPFTVNPPNALQALMMGVQGYDSAQKGLKEREIAAARKEAGNLYAQGGDTRGAMARLIGAGDTKSMSALAQLEAAQRGASGVYGTPIYGTDQQGNTVLGVIGKQGQFKRIDTGGVTPTPGVRYLDTGTGYVPMNSRTGQPMSQGGGPIAKDVAGEARQKKLGAEQGDKIANASQAKLKLDTVFDQMDRLAHTAKGIRDNPSLDRITGLTGMFPSFPGGKAADVEAELKVLKSQIAYAVLQGIRDASKTGGAVGQVSNYETELFQNNLAAVDQLQSAGKFKEAMDLLVKYTEGAKKRMQSAYENDYGGQQQQQQRQETMAAPSNAVNALRSNPALRGQFDAKYGPGSAAKVLGQ